jgi:hypothetical protein
MTAQWRYILLDTWYVDEEMTFSDGRFGLPASWWWVRGGTDKVNMIL